MSTPRTSRRQFLRMAAFSSATIALVACGGGAPAAEAPAESDGEEPAPAAEGVVLTQWYHEYGEAGTQEAVYRIAEEYSEMTDGASIEVTWNPGDYTTKLFSALAAGTGPDVYEEDLTVAMVEAGQVAPLDELFTPEIKEDFVEKDLELKSVEGTIYGISMIIDMGMLYSRKSILDEAGITPPETWDEMVEASIALDTGRQKGLFLGNDGGISASRDMSMYAAGLSWNDGAEIVFDPAETGEVYAKLAELNKTGSLLIGSPTDWWDPSALTQGLAAMQWCGLWAMPGIRDQIEEDFYVTPWPSIDIGNGAATPATFWGGWTQFVNGQTENMPEALAYVNWQWIENTDWQNEWAAAYGFHVPPRKSAAASNDKLTEGNAKTAVDILYAYGRDNGPYFTGAMQTARLDAISNVVKNDADPTEEFTKARETCDAEMEALMG